MAGRKQQCKLKSIHFPTNSHFIVVRRRIKEASHNISSADAPANLKLSTSLSSLPIKSLLTSEQEMRLTGLLSTWVTYKIRRIKSDAAWAALCNHKMSKQPSTCRLRTSTTFSPTNSSASLSWLKQIRSLRATRRTFHAFSGARAPLASRHEPNSRSPNPRSTCRSSGRASRCKRCRVRHGPWYRSLKLIPNRRICTRSWQAPAPSPIMPRRLVLYFLMLTIQGSVAPDYFNRSNSSEDKVKINEFY